MPCSWRPWPVPHPHPGAWSPGVCLARALGGGHSHFLNLDVTVTPSRV